MGKLAKVKCLVTVMKQYIEGFQCCHPATDNNGLITIMKISL